MFLVIRVVLIFLLVAVLAGGIAMLGNQLGRKIGRRKMTVFGMRPRHTSIFITTITGSLIACLTLGLAMVLSQDVRDSVLGSQERVEKLKKRESVLQNRIQELADRARRGAIVWNYLQPMALNTIPAGEDEQVVANIIGNTLKYANYSSITKNNEIAGRLDEAPIPLERVILQYTAEDFRSWVEKYSYLDEPVGLWIKAGQNCLFGDEVPVELEAKPVKLLYKKGEVVYSAQTSASEFLLDWHVFIEDLKKEVLSKNMYELDNSLGAEIGADTLSEISRIVERSHGPITLEAIAERDLYQSSKLAVTIRVKQ